MPSILYFAKKVQKGLAAITQKSLHFPLRKMISRGDNSVPIEKLSFSNSNSSIQAFFTKQNINLTSSLFNELLGFLSTACIYKEEDQKIRPSIIICNHLLDIQIAQLTQATVIPFVSESVEKTHLVKRLKSMLPFCNNGWRVFVSLEGSNLTYGILRNFNGPSGLNVDDLLSTMSTSERMSLNINFVLIDVTSDFEILLRGSSDICSIDFRLVTDEKSIGAQSTQLSFCQDLLSAYDFDIRKVTTAYKKTINLFPQKLHGSICIIISYEYNLPDDILKDGIFLETPIDICPILTEDLSEKQVNQDIGFTISAHEKFHAFMGLLLEMLNIDGITVVDNKGRIRAYNVFVSPDATGVEDLSGGARKRAANY